jgi:hypothetical protein
MLIGKGSRRPNLKRIRSIKEALQTALSLSNETTITVTELTCLEEGCAPIETVVALLKPNAPTLQHKIHKSTDAIEVDDLMKICRVWGFDVQAILFESFNKEI